MGQPMSDPASDRPDPAFRAAVLDGLKTRPRAIGARWLYDLKGSELFEAITDLPEYYPTRTERALLECFAGEVGEAIGAGRAVIEFGSGSSAKTPLLLGAIRPAAYVPIDISGEFLREAADGLAAEFPDLPVHPVEADFTRKVDLPAEVEPLPKLGFFPGSTIGIKDPTVLVPAYDDAQGVTAAFNLNLIARINRELGGTMPADAFRHRAIWNDNLARIEMHIEAVRDVDFEVAGVRFHMAAAETIHTENSHKYGPRDARILLRAGGWTMIREWTDEKDQFALILAEAQPERTAP
ncbi:MAG: L-histidine N(alpha)-methyltransferase [Sphingomonadales bacterium]|nr:L-histidine N(alpha)-methyltransferase [Sphingomonadales bacterium]